MRHSLRAVLTPFVLALLLFSIPAAADEVTVFAAASLTNAMGEVGKAFETKEKHTVRFSFASSSTLAKQIENGAPAHLFLSADLDWMDYLDQRKLIVDGSRVNLLGNLLVMIAPVSSTLKVDLKPGIDLAGLLSGGLLATGDPDHVPARQIRPAGPRKVGILERHRGPDRQNGQCARRFGAGGALPSARSGSFLRDRCRRFSKSEGGRSVPCGQFIPRSSIRPPW